jgi:hypothetical protein
VDAVDITALRIISLVWRDYFRWGVMEFAVEIGKLM